MILTITIKATVSEKIEEKVADPLTEAYRYHPLSLANDHLSLRRRLLEGGNTTHNPLPTVDQYKSIKGSSNDRRRLVVSAVQIQSISYPSSKGGKDDDYDNALGFLLRAEEAVKQAVRRDNATIVLVQELFLSPYFCQSQDAALFSLAEEIDDGDIDDRTCLDYCDAASTTRNPFLLRMRRLARSLGVVLPISMFERRNNAYFNSVVMIESDGSILGIYRKSHIPDGTGYQEKFYFSPGDTGFRVFQTSVGNIGVGICWDQWFPEAARAMALQGADVLLYPTAIGSEPQDPTLDSSGHWQRVMQGHAAANMVPVVASNRIGTEVLLNGQNKEQQRINFFGRSFISDETGTILKEAINGPMDIITVEIDIEANRAARAAWGLFRDRRPDLYGVLRTKDGQFVKD